MNVKQLTKFVEKLDEECGFCGDGKTAIDWLKSLDQEADARVAWESCVNGSWLVGFVQNLVSESSQLWFDLNDVESEETICKTCGSHDHQPSVKAIRKVVSFEKVEKLVEANLFESESKKKSKKKKKKKSTRATRR